MNKLESLEGLVQKSGAVASSVPAGKAGKAKKTPKARDPSAPPKAPNAWILFTSRVRSVINESGVLGEKKLGKECTQFCSSLKEENAELDSWAAETILARFSGWTVPEQSKMAAAGISFAKKNKGSEAAAPESEAAAEPDGGQGEWAGIFNPKTKTIDSSVPEPSEDEDFEVLEA